MLDQKLILTGQTDSHTEIFEDEQRVHREVIAPLKELLNQAAKQGFRLSVVSGYRSFERQIQIWNKKVSAADKNLDPQKIIASILRWSALPGASRHHWGTDLDVIDAARLNEGMQVQLVPQEFEAGGPFCELHDWLDENMNPLGFFRPYQTDRGGVSPERWHLSYAPLANGYLADLSEDLVRTALNQSSILLKEEVLKNLSNIFSTYVRNIDSVSPVY